MLKLRYSLNDIFNINSKTESKSSLIKPLLLFYLTLGSKYTNKLLTDKFDKFISNRYITHLIAFITLLVIIIEIGQISDIKNSLIYTSIGYLWFIFTTKLSLNWNILIIVSLLGGYLYETNLNNKNNRLKNDESLDENIIYKIYKDNLKSKTNFNLVLFFATLVGTIYYIQKISSKYNFNFDNAQNIQNKQIGGKKNFDPIKFLLD